MEEEGGEKDIVIRMNSRDYRSPSLRMTNPRPEILSLVGEALRLAPEVRVGQLVAVPGDPGQIEAGRPLADLYDGEPPAVLRRHVADLSARASAVA